MITREQKTKIIGDMRGRLEAAQIVVIANGKGLGAEQMASLRRRAKAAGGRAQVVKNTLAKRAIDGTAFAPLAEQLSGQLIYGMGDDPAGLAKAFADFARDNDKLRICGGALAEQTMDAAAVNTLAALPPREVLLAQLAALLASPMTRLAGVLAAVPAGLARALDAVRAQKESR